MMNPVQGYPGLYKNSSGVLVNKNKSEREAHRRMKEQALKQIESQNEIDDLKKEVGELKGLIMELINNHKG
jgi:hypothetical protein